MQYTTLGRTGLKVSVAGLGCGGFSRLGLGTGKTEAEAIGIIRLAMDLGVNLIDTAAVYGTEEVVGRAIAGSDRDSLVICTKASRPQADPRFTVPAILESLDGSLKRLGLDHVDVFQLHAVPPAQYDYVRNEIVPALLREKQRGKFRFLGITETSPNDHEHRMMQAASRDTPWDTAMFAFNLMHQPARETVFPFTRANGIGTLMMFAVRSIFARPAQLAETVKDLVAKGQLPAEFAATGTPLDFLVHPGGADSVTDAAYRYVRHEPGVDVVLFGTGEPAHLRANIASLLKPALPQADRDRLASMFSHLRGVGLEIPPMARERAARG